MEKPKTSLRSALLGNCAKEGRAELKSDIRKLYETVSGYDLADAVIARVQRYAVESLGMNSDTDFGEMSAEESMRFWRLSVMS